MHIETVKIIIGGARKVGKKSFIGAVTEEEYVAGSWQNGRPERPKELFRRADFGRIVLDDYVCVYLFNSGHPNFALELFRENLNGFCLLIDSTNPRSIYEGQAILKYITLLDPVSHIIVANKQDREDAMTVGQIRREMNLPAETPILPCVATERASVANVLNTLLPMIRPDVQERIK